jgi:L-alanine-DL-glutamate epimerase-like enolase superfamily enzyme
VKIKVGKPDLREDAERVAAVRTVLGPDRRLMIDANQRWDLPTTLRALDVLAGYGLDWLEEPLRADDLWAYRRLRKHSPVPIALGENLHTIYRFRDFIEAKAVDIIQPNIIRVGGITPFRRIVELARTHSIKVMPHLLPELSGQLALTLAEPTMVEDVEEASFEQLGLLAGPSPVRFNNSRLATADRQGLGLRFREAL